MNHMIREKYCLIKPLEKTKEDLGGFQLPTDESTIQAEGILKLNGSTEDAFPLESTVIYNKTRAIEVVVEKEKYHLVDEKFVFIALNVLEETK